MLAGRGLRGSVIRERKGTAIGGDFLVWEKNSYGKTWEQGDSPERSTEILRETEPKDLTSIKQPLSSQRKGGRLPMKRKSICGKRKMVNYCYSGNHGLRKQ